MALNDILKLRLHCRMHGGEVINVLHFVDDVGLDVDNAQALANDFLTNMGTVARARAAPQLFFEYVEVIKIVPYGEGPRVATFAGGSNGQASVISTSATLAEVVTIHSSQIGRRKRGRMYLAGGANTADNGGNWPASQTTRTQTFATAMATRYMAAGHPSAFSLGIWSKLTAGPDPPWSTDAFTRATSLTVRTLIRNQRRRQVGVGR